jgi:ketol-acid reductoisomerase
MKRLLNDIQSGEFARDWMLANQVNQTSSKAAGVKLRDQKGRAGRQDGLNLCSLFAGREPALGA